MRRVSLSFTPYFSQVPWLDLRIAVTFVPSGIKVIGPGISPDQCPSYHSLPEEQSWGLRIDTESGPLYAGCLCRSDDGLQTLAVSSYRTLSARYTAAQACQIAMRLLESTIATSYSEKIKAVRIFSQKEQ